MVQTRRYCHTSQTIAGRQQSGKRTIFPFLEDGSYIRLRNVTLGYNLPESVLQKLKIGSVRMLPGRG